MSGSPYQLLLLRWLLKTLGYYKLPIGRRQDLFIFFRILPRVLMGREAREQKKNMKTFFPSVPFRPRLIRVRDWGAGFSLALSDEFEVDVDTVVTGLHPEVSACIEGGDLEAHYFATLVNVHGWDPQSAEARRRKSKLLLK